MAAATPEVVRYGIVGVGMMGREHLHNLVHLAAEVEREQSVLVRVTCLADPHLESLRLGLQLVANLGLPAPETFSGHRELLDSGLCDAIIVSSPNMTHYEILMDIISHQKPHHILVEKPLCTTVEHCKEVIEAAKQRPDILVQVGLEYRYMPPVAKLIDIVKSGTLGQVRMVAIREHRFPFLVKVNNWNRFNCNSGGTLVEKCCHFFDLMRLFAAANPVRVMASGSIDVNHKDEVYDGKVPDIIDNAYVIIEFDNGSRGMLDLCMFAEGSKNEQEISVVGDIGKGEAFVPESIVRFGKRTGGRDGVVTIMVDDERIKYQGLHHGSSYLEHLNFLSAIRAQGGSGPSVNLNDGLLSVAIGVAGQLSIEQGRFVTMEEVLGLCTGGQREGKATANVTYNEDDGHETYSNLSVHSRLSEYTSMAREVHGPEYNPANEELDGEVVMRVGGGKKHGRYWIANSAIDSTSTPTLSQIRARSTSAAPDIRPRPDTSQYRIQTLQNELEEERRQRQELAAAMAAERAEREAQQQKMAEMLAFMQSLGAATGVTPPPSLFAPPPPPPPPHDDPFSTPNQSAASNDPHISPNQSGWPNW